MNNKNNDKEKCKQDSEENTKQSASQKEDDKDTAQDKPITKEEFASLWNKHLRLYADFDNARKRWEREREDIMKSTEANMLRDILVIFDEIEQALKMTREHSDIVQITKGLEMTRNNFLNILNKKGVHAIETKDKKFDPHLHEIAGSREIENSEEHMVLEEVQKGYLYEGKVIRTSKVIVSVKKQRNDKKNEQTKTENDKDGLGEA